MHKVKPILFGPLPPPFGGVAVFMTAVSTKALQQGVRVWSYTGKPPNENQNEILFVNHRRFGHLLALWREGRRARITDSTHFHLEHPNALLLPLWLLSKVFLRFKWVKILHDGSLPPRYKDFSRLKRWLCRLALRHIDEFVVYNEQIEAWLREKVPPDKQVNFVSLLMPLASEWHVGQLEEDVTQVLDRYSQHAVRVCSVGIFIPEYGFHNVANTVEKMREETGTDIGLMLIDGGFECDDGYRSSVACGREWISVIQNVTQTAVARSLKISNVFVRAPAHESYGISRIEALWCGVPVIATNVGETRGMFLYEYGDEATLLAHLKNVLNGGRVPDAKRWADNFQIEAEKNLENYLRVIKGDEILR
jgi:glycosyltransferase involved in cell wall biosynthesis